MNRATQARLFIYEAAGKPLPPAAYQLAVFAVFLQHSLESVSVLMLRNSLPLSVLFSRLRVSCAGSQMRSLACGRSSRVLTLYPINSTATDTRDELSVLGTDYVLYCPTRYAAWTGMR